MDMQTARTAKAVRASLYPKEVLLYTSCQT